MPHASEHEEKAMVVRLQSLQEAGNKEWELPYFPVWLNNEF